MNFWDQVFATFCGSIFGFVFAIILFYITESRKKDNAKGGIAKCLKREFEYNLTLLQEWIDILDRILRSIGAENRAIYDFVKYSNYQRFYLYQSFQFGMAYDFFDNDDVAKLSKIENHLNLGVEQFVNAKFEEWKRNEMPTSAALPFFEFQRTSLIEGKKIVSGLLAKF